MARKKRRSKRWFKPKRKTGWHKDDPASIRRQRVLRAFHNNALRAGRAMLALANVTRDPETKRKARQDAEYFFELHRENQ